MTESGEILEQAKGLIGGQVEKSLTFCNKYLDIQGSIFSFYIKKEK